MSGLEALLSSEDNAMLGEIVLRVCASDRMGLQGLAFVADLTDDSFWHGLRRYAGLMRPILEDGRYFSSAIPFSDGRGLSIETKIVYASDLLDYIVLSTELIFDFREKRFRVRSWIV